MRGLSLHGLLESLAPRNMLQPYENSAEGLHEKALQSWKSYGRNGSICTNAPLRYILYVRSYRLLLFFQQMLRAQCGHDGSDVLVQSDGTRNEALHDENRTLGVRPHGVQQHELQYGVERHEYRGELAHSIYDHGGGLE